MRMGRRVRGPAAGRSMTALALLLAGCSLAGCAGDGAGPPAPASIDVDPAEFEFSELGESRSFQATVRDARGNALEVAVLWRSSNPAVVEVDPSGTATARSAGSARIEASAGGVSGAAQVRVEPGPRISAGALPDARSSIAYSTILSATSPHPPIRWELAAGTLPPGLALSSEGILRGMPGAPGTTGFSIRATDARGASRTAAISLRICDPPLRLAPGGLQVGPIPAPSSCAPMLASGEEGDLWRVGFLASGSLTAPTKDTISLVLSVSRVAPAALESPADASGLGVGALRIGSHSTGLPVWALHPPGTRLELPPSAREMARGTELFHKRLRDSERALFSGPEWVPLPSHPPEHLASGARSSAPELTAPARRTFIPYSDGQCANPAAPRVGTRLLEDERFVVYQDSIQRITAPANPVHLERMLAYYRDFGVGVIDEYFGAPPDVDGNGRLVIFISPAVQSGVAAFVWSGDLFARSSCAGSNEMELVYFNASTIAGMANGDFQALGTLVHEIKHVSSLHRRIRHGRQPGSSGSPYHAVWVEEGSAEIAAEISSRRAWASRGGPLPGARLDGGTIRSAGFTPENYGTILRLARTVDFLGSQPNSLTADPNGAPERHSFYGSSWHFHRFLGDAYGTALGRSSEAEFFRAQNDSLTAPAPGSFPTLLGRSMEGLLDEFLSAIQLTGSGAPQPPRTFSTYDFPSAAEVFRNPDPIGIYPWPVTTTGSSDSTAVSWAPFASGLFSGAMGGSGVRIHDFRSDGSGAGIELRPTRRDGGAFEGRMVISRIR